ncbi:MAG: helix-turn-helix domain-containing protein [Planctomycetaceae bacterium]
MVSKGKSQARRLVRARILSLADQAVGGAAKSDPEIVEALGCGRTTVKRVRRAFVEEGLEETLEPSPSTRVYES